MVIYLFGNHFIIYQKWHFKGQSCLAGYAHSSMPGELSSESLTCRYSNWFRHEFWCITKKPLYKNLLLGYVELQLQIRQCFWRGRVNCKTHAYIFWSRQRNHSSVTVIGYLLSVFLMFLDTVIVSLTVMHSNVAAPIRLLCFIRRR